MKTIKKVGFIIGATVTAIVLVYVAMFLASVWFTMWFIAKGIGIMIAVIFIVWGAIKVRNLTRKEGKDV